MSISELINSLRIWYQVLLWVSHRAKVISHNLFNYRMIKNQIYIVKLFITLKVKSQQNLMLAGNLKMIQLLTGQV